MEEETVEEVVETPVVEIEDEEVPLSVLDDEEETEAVVEIEEEEVPLAAGGNNKAVIGAASVGVAGVVGGGIIAGLRQKFGFLGKKSDKKKN